MAAYTRAHGLRLRPAHQDAQDPGAGAAAVGSGSGGADGGEGRRGGGDAGGEAGRRSAGVSGDRPEQGGPAGRRSPGMRASPWRWTARRPRASSPTPRTMPAWSLACSPRPMSGWAASACLPASRCARWCAPIARMRNLCFEGISFFPGHIHTLDEAGMRAIDDLKRLIGRMLDDVRSEGLEARVVSGGNTTDGASFSPAGRSQRDPLRHLYLQRPEHGLLRRVRLRGLRGRGAGDGRLHGRGWTDDHRRRIEDVLLRRVLGAAAELRSRRGGAPGHVHQDERGARIRRHRGRPAASLRSANACA